MGIRASVAVVGAGLAGLTCARQLRDAGHRVQVFERDKAMGGRLRTERHEHFRYDSGAQYLTARTREFRRLLDGLSLSGHVQNWTPRLLLGGADLIGEITPQDWFVGIPGMGSLVRPLAEDLRVHLETRVTGFFREGPKWFVETQDDAAPHGPFHAVLLTGSAPESYPLLAPHDDLFDEMTRVRMIPCWSLALEFDAPIALNFDVGSSITESIAWMARDSSKPNRRRGQEVWVIQSSPEFSRETMEEEPEDVVQLLWNEVRESLQLGDIEPVDVATHCWRHALVERTLGASCVFSRDTMLGAAGDWCLGSRAEAAHESAMALARRVNDTFAVM